MPALGNLLILPPPSSSSSSSPALHLSGDATCCSSSVMVETRPEGPVAVAVAAVTGFESKCGSSPEAPLAPTATGSESKCSRSPEDPVAAQASEIESNCSRSLEAPVAAQATEIESKCSCSPEARLAALAAGSCSKYKRSPESPVAAAAARSESKSRCSPEIPMAASAAGSESKSRCSPKIPVAAAAAGSESKSRCSPEAPVAAQASEIETNCSRSLEVPLAAQASEIESKCSRSSEASVAAGSGSKCRRSPESSVAAAAARSESKSRCSPEGAVATEASEIEPNYSRRSVAAAPTGSKSRSSHSPEGSVVADPSGFECTVAAKHAGLESKCSGSTEGPLAVYAADFESKWSHSLRFPILTARTVAGLRKQRRKASKKVEADDGKTSLADYVSAWKEKKMASGVPETKCFLPFLNNAPKMDICPKCGNFIFPGEEVHCSKGHCRQTYHLACAIEIMGPVAAKGFKCPQHACFVCGKAGYWRCVRCTAAAHVKCSPWPADIVHLESQSKRAICWRHPSDWRLEKKHAGPTANIEEAFLHLPLPYVDEEFKIGSFLKNATDNESEPAPYIHIRRNAYLIKKKREDAETGIGCTNCNANSTCKENCECRGLSVSCSKSCHCSDMCRNRPFRKEKKIKIVKTENCGWGAVTLEAIEKQEFVIEYIGEVIDDATCEKRLWDMKHRGDQNFYMCELRKDFTIDATFKGNASRFLNHSCDPNCKLEKWQVDGETRVGVFASRLIEAGEPLTYDYRFVHFGPMVECHCGAANCQGYLGSKRKMNEIPPAWGRKRKRTFLSSASK